MKTIQEMIEVMQAYERGEQVQFCFWDDNSIWENVDGAPIWNWIECDYRVKPKKKKYVPFETAEEFLKAQKEHGTKIGLYGSNSFNNSYISYDKEVFIVKYNGWSKIFLCELNENWIFEDGTPCGKEVEE